MEYKIYFLQFFLLVFDHLFSPFGCWNVFC